MCIEACAWVQVPCADRATSHPLMAFTVPASLHTLQGVSNTKRAQSLLNMQQSPVSS